MSMIAVRAIAKTGPPPANAVEVEAAIGILTTVAMRNRVRTGRPLPDIAFAAQVNCCHGSHSKEKSSAAFPAPAQVGSFISSATSWEKANTYARSKKSSTGSAVKSSVSGGSSMPFMCRECT